MSQRLNPNMRRPYTAAMMPPDLPGSKHARRKRGEAVTLTPSDDPQRVDTSVTPVTIPRLPDCGAVRKARARREAERAERQRLEREGECA